VLFLLIISIGFADDDEPFEEYEPNASIFDDSIVILDSSLEQVNVICDLSDIEINDTLEVTYPDIDYIFRDDTFIDDVRLGPFVLKTINTKKNKQSYKI